MNISWDSGPNPIIRYKLEYILIINILSTRFDQMLKAYIVAEFKYENLVQILVTCPTSTI